jgi:hypothetical protein
MIIDHTLNFRLHCIDPLSADAPVLLFHIGIEVELLYSRG